MERPATGKTGELENVIFVCFGERPYGEWDASGDGHKVIDLFCHSSSAADRKVEPLRYPVDVFGDEAG